MSQMSICRFANFSRGYTPGPPLTAEGKKQWRKTGREKRENGKENVGDEGYRTKRREGWDKGEGEGQRRREVHSPAFSSTPPPSLNHLKVSLELKVCNQVRSSYINQTTIITDAYSINIGLSVQCKSHGIR
jgi:hypothetical protein